MEHRELCLFFIIFLSLFVCITSKISPTPQQINLTQYDSNEACVGNILVGPNSDWTLVIFQNSELDRSTLLLLSQSLEVEDTYRFPSNYPYCQLGNNAMILQDNSTVLLFCQSTAYEPSGTTMYEFQVSNSVIKPIRSKLFPYVSFSFSSTSSISSSGQLYALALVQSGSAIYQWNAATYDFDFLLTAPGSGFLLFTDFAFFPDRNCFILSQGGPALAFDPIFFMYLNGTSAMTPTFGSSPIQTYAVGSLGSFVYAIVTQRMGDSMIMSWGSDLALYKNITIASQGPNINWQNAFQTVYDSSIFYISFMDDYYSSPMTIDQIHWTDDGMFEDVTSITTDFEVQVVGLQYQIHGLVADGKYLYVGGCNVLYRFAYTN